MKTLFASAIMATTLLLSASANATVEKAPTVSASVTSTVGVPTGGRTIRECELLLRLVKTSNPMLYFVSDRRAKHPDRNRIDDLGGYYGFYAYDIPGGARGEAKHVCLAGGGLYFDGNECDYVTTYLVGAATFQKRYRCWNR